jgi:oligopeptide transport system substrate-binding protein
VNRDGRVPAYSFVPPGIANYTAPQRLAFADWPKEKRQAEARRLLAEAGFGPKNPLRFAYNIMTGRDPRRQAIAETALWAQVGIVAQPIVNEPKIHYVMTQQHDFDVAWVAWVADFDDPQNFLSLLDARSEIFNYGGYNNPIFDGLLDQAAALLDIEKRSALLAEAERIALADNAVIPTAFRTAKILVANYVKGFQGNSTNVHRTRWMRIERPT